VNLPLAPPKKRLPVLFLNLSKNNYFRVYTILKEKLFKKINRIS